MVTLRLANADNSMLIEELEPIPIKQKMIVFAGFCFNRKVAI
mgnify:CR=1 FL=1